MLTSYLVLFSSAFLAATVLPFYSEVFLYAMALQGRPGVILVLVATLGNTLGAVINWLLGLYILHFRDRRWFYFNERQIERAQAWFQHYGIWTLLFAWLPVGGDALTLIAGVMRVRLPVFLVLVALGKSVRYIFIVYLADVLQFPLWH